MGSIVLVRQDDLVVLADQNGGTRWLLDDGMGFP